jgi:CRP/FNR family transcriptional regulator, nitrogen oxide reductase regulator
MTAIAPLPSPALASMELFLDLPPAALDEVMASARLRHLAKETRIFDQGDPAERAHALIDGSARISQSGCDGGQVVIRFIGPGEMFGTVALFTDRQYPADAITLTDALDISWSEAELLDLISRHPQIAMNVIRIIGKRLKEAQERVRELSTQRAERRVAHMVLRLARQAGQSTINGTAIEFPLRRKDVADISGTTLHTASRILTAWEKAGLLVSDNQRLTIRRPSDIQRIADDLPL